MSVIAREQELRDFAVYCRAVEAFTVGTLNRATWHERAEWADACAADFRGAVSALDLARGTLKRVAEGCEEPAFGAAMCLKAIDHLHPGGQ